MKSPPGSVGMVLHPLREIEEPVDRILTWASTHQVRVLGLKEEVERLQCRAVAVSEIEMAEQKRWMVWVGSPFLIASLFVALTFATDDAWWLGLAITAMVAAIFSLIWLAMTSDTNGVIGEPAPSH